jgi:23S rRNA pseudouridine2604 synthase
MNNPDSFPMRINKYLAHKGVATRTGADELIKSHKVLINGKVAVLGDKVLETDMVEVRGKHTKKKYVYFAYNKPKGVVTANPQGDEIDILQSLQKVTTVPQDIFPVGRLDKDSYGLIILSNDGRITDRLLNPRYEHQKEYVVEVSRSYSPAFIKHMREGVMLDDEMTKPAIVNRLSDTKFSIILTEGRNRQIRRMTEKLEYTVTDLKRVRIQNIVLGKQVKNTLREIVGEEQDAFLASIGLK